MTHARSTYPRSDEIVYERFHQTIYMQHTTQRTGRGAIPSRSDRYGLASSDTMKRNFLCGLIPIESFMTCVLDDLSVKHQLRLTKSK